MSNQPRNVPEPPSRSPAPSGAPSWPRLREPFRLSPATCADGRCFSITIVTSGRRRLFQSAQAFRRALARLRESAAKFGAVVYAYCFMLDHLHLLASTPLGIRSDEFMRHFKKISFVRLRLEPGMIRLWHPSYYDQALRSDEALTAVADYIFNNPVRSGLVGSAADYAFFRIIRVGAGVG